MIMTPEVKQRLDLLLREIKGIRAYLGHLEEIAHDLREHLKPGHVLYPDNVLNADNLNKSEDHE